MFKNKLRVGVAMKTSEFLGKRVLDKDADEVGRISDMDIKPKKGVIDCITISTGVLGLKGKFEVTPEELKKVGDYVILTIEKTEIEGRVEDYMKKYAEEAKTTLKKVGLKVSEGEKEGKVKISKIKKKEVKL